MGSVTRLKSRVVVKAPCGHTSGVWSSSYPLHMHYLKAQIHSCLFKLCRDMNKTAPLGFEIIFRAKLTMTMLKIVKWHMPFYAILLSFFKFYYLIIESLAAMWTP